MTIQNLHNEMKIKSHWVILECAQNHQKLKYETLQDLYEVREIQDDNHSEEVQV